MAIPGLPSRVTVGFVKAGIPLHPCSAPGKEVYISPADKEEAHLGSALGNWQEVSCSHGYHLPKTTCGVFPWNQHKELG